ncbi:MAG: PD-(D/E)XK nuclease family protein [Sulfuricurvum sp.]|jgi:inactivated superfamily I helicase/RecB family exonuclease
MLRACVVFPTSRAIRNALDGCVEGFLPTFMGMSDFLDRAILTENVVIPDDDLRLLGLHEASDFSSFSSLQIERNFFTFIQNSQYIFRFFEELSGEMVDISALENADIYGEYEEHITILKHLLHRYGEVTIAKGWSDPIFSKSVVKINEGYVREFDSVTVHVEGYLSRYELKVLEACAAITPLQCVYHATAYNEKMTERLRKLSIEVEEGHRIVFSLSTRQIIESMPIEKLGNVICEVFRNRLIQVGFVKAKIANMVEDGISPENIVVVVPDEQFARYLRLLDEENNFNFAMGTSMEDERIIRNIDAIELYLEEQSAENKARVSKVDSDLIEWVKGHYRIPFSYVDLEHLCETLSESIQRAEAKEILSEELHRFKPLCDALSTVEFKSAMRIFLNRVKSRSIDDVGGGKITVMGLLETRGMSFEGVIVVDFNEGYVPHRSQKDLFLNTQTRKIADLPTTADRESLQKHYYWMLFNRARKVAIACVQNAESVPSRFLLQLGIRMREAKVDYASAILPKPLFNERERRVIESEYDFTAHALSSSGLKSFLTCKRQFYYKYIEKIKEHEKPQDLSREREVGNRLHNALEKIYALSDHYKSALEIKQALGNALHADESYDVLQRYVEELWIEKLVPFYEYESKRFASGIRVGYREKESDAIIEGIRLTGRIDRIDRTDDGLEVLDYKTGKYASTSSDVSDKDVDYQLSIYALLCEQLGTVARCGVYDLNTGKIEFEQFLEAKTQKLKEILQMLSSNKQWVWEMSEDLSHCRYCTYATLCEREL